MQVNKLKSRALAFNFYHNVVGGSRGRIKQPVGCERKKNIRQCQYKFCNNWLSLKFCKDWLVKSEIVNKMGDENAHCKVCNVDIVAHKNDIKRHSESRRHKDNIKVVAANRRIADMTNKTLNKNSRREELKLCGLLDHIIYHLL